MCRGSESRASSLPTIRRSTPSPIRTPFAPCASSTLTCIFIRPRWGPIRRAGRRFKASRIGRPSARAAGATAGRYRRFLRRTSCSVRWIANRSRRPCFSGGIGRNRTRASGRTGFLPIAVRAHPDRLAAFATIHPAVGAAAVREEIRWAHDAGFCGLGELSPHSQHSRLDDPVLAVALELAGELGMPVNFHVTDPTGKKYPGRVETPLDDFRRLARAYPADDLILAHWGGGLPLLETNPDVRATWPMWSTTPRRRLSFTTPGSGGRPRCRLAGKGAVWQRLSAGALPADRAAPGWRGILAEIEQAGLNAARKASCWLEMRCGCSISSPKIAQ